MDRIVIINGNEGDDLVTKNGLTIRFNLDKYLRDKSIWAVQWYGDHGEIEYKDKPPEQIKSMQPFFLVMAKFDRLAQAQAQD